MFHKQIYISPLRENDRISLIFKESRRKNLPRNIFYGDGQPIEIAVLNHIREAYNQEKNLSGKKETLWCLIIFLLHIAEKLIKGKEKLQLLLFRSIKFHNSYLNIVLNHYIKYTIN